MQAFPSDQQQNGFANSQQRNVDPTQDTGEKKESILLKVKDKAKDKAKKLKDKLQKKKKRGHTNEEAGNDSNGSDSSSEDESDQSQPSSGQKLPVSTNQGQESLLFDENKGVEGFAKRDNGDERFEATPDPDAPGGAGALQNRFDKLNLGSKDDRKVQEEVPSAPGQVSAGVTPYLAAHGFSHSQSQPKDDQEPASHISSMKYEDFGKTAERVLEVEGPKNDGVWYSPSATSENVATTDDHNMDTQFEKGNSGDQKSMLEQDETMKQSDEKKSTITSRATETVLGLKDSLASKLGYGVNSPTSQGDDVKSEETKSNGTAVGDSKSYIQKLQDTAGSAKDLVAKKLGYGETKSVESVDVDTHNDDQQQKSYIQKLQESAGNAKDVVAKKLGYGETKSIEGMEEQKSYLEKVQEVASSGKDAIVSKLGYNSDAKAVNNNNENVDSVENNQIPSRFHPGEEDKALSQLITEAMSNSATTMKDTLLAPFSAKASSMPSDDASKDGVYKIDPAMDSSAAANRSGIVGRVSGVVSSFLGSSKKTEDHELTGKAMEESTANIESYAEQKQ